MKAKQIITGVLLGFVALSLVAVAVKELRVQGTDKAGIQGDRMIVYFFHGNRRCKTCNSMEQYTRQALQENFPRQISDGSLELKIVNLDESGNGHFVDDYDMDVRVVVLSRIVAGKEIGWKKLEGVWDLSGDEEAFKRYVASGVTEMLSGGGQ